MKKPAKGKKPAQHGKPRGPKGPVIWAIVLLDGEPIRRKAASDCQWEMAKLEKAKTDWKRYEQEDLPIFGRWMAVTFGSLQTEMRELRSKIRSKEDLIHEVEMEMSMTGRNSYSVAYESLRLRKDREQARLDRARAAQRDIPEEDESDESWQQQAGPEPKQGPPPPDQDLEAELMFEEYLETFLGIDPTRLSDVKYEQMFTEFKEKVLGGKGRHELPGRREEGRKEAEKPSRLKELYRLLVRRLHPDTKADVDAAVSALWHEVQEAYSHGNIERLEMLLALTDIQSETTGEHTTVSQMLAVLKELRRSTQALMRSLSQAKKELAWDFSRLGARPEFEAKIRRQMERDRDFFRQQLQELEKFVAGWKVTRRKKQKRNPRQAEMPL